MNRPYSLAPFLVPVALILSACGSSGEGTHLSTTTRSTLSAVPLHHRARAASCSPTPLLAEPVLTGDAGSLGGPPSMECATHADCKAGPNGRCVNVTDCAPDTPNCGTYCVYEACTKDDDCGSGSACFCSDDATFCAGGYAASCPVQGDHGVCSCGIANQCKKGNCRADSDCGPGGYCSPALDACGTVRGYFCHAAADECVNDEDCAGKDAGIPVGVHASCLPDPNASDSRWVCTPPANCP